MISGGAAIEGATRAVALVKNSPRGRTAWVAVAAKHRNSNMPWRLVVTAICARSGNQ